MEESIPEDKGIEKEIVSNIINSYNTHCGSPVKLVGSIHVLLEEIFLHTKCSHSADVVN